MFKKTANRYPTNVNRNDYENNRKKSTIETPQWLADFIYESIYRLVLKKKGKNILLDVGCHKGNLTNPFLKRFKCYGMDNKPDEGYSGDEYMENQFLATKAKGFKIKPSVIVCNPPFNVSDTKAMKEGKDCMEEYGLSGKSPLLPEMFLRKIFENFGTDIPLVLFSPMGMLKNQRLTSPRWKWLRDCGAKITSEIELPIDAYIPRGAENNYNDELKNWKTKNSAKLLGTKKYETLLDKKQTALKDKHRIILVHSSILIFNIKGLPARIFVPNRLAERTKIVRVKFNRKNKRLDSKRFSLLVD